MYMSFDETCTYVIGFIDVEKVSIVVLPGLEPTIPYSQGKCFTASARELLSDFPHSNLQLQPNENTGAKHSFFSCQLRGNSYCLTRMYFLVHFPSPVPSCLHFSSPRRHSLYGHDSLSKTPMHPYSA